MPPRKHSKERSHSIDTVTTEKLNLPTSTSSDGNEDSLDSNLGTKSSQSHGHSVIPTSTTASMHGLSLWNALLQVSERVRRGHATISIPERTRVVVLKLPSATIQADTIMDEAPREEGEMDDSEKQCEQNVVISSVEPGMKVQRAFFFDERAPIASAITRAAKPSRRGKHRRFHCPECQSNVSAFYNSKVELFAHLVEMHTQEIANRCPVGHCNQFFKIRQRMWEHVAEVHGNDPLVHERTDVDSNGNMHNQE